MLFINEYLRKHVIEWLIDSGSLRKRCAKVETVVTVPQRLCQVTLANILRSSLGLRLRGSLTTRPLSPSQLDNVASTKDPVFARCLSLAGQLRSPHGRLRNDISILTKSISDTSAEMAKTVDCPLSNTLHCAAGLSVTEDHAGLENHG